MLDLAAAYGTLAAATSTSLVALAYGWVAAQPAVDSILIGPASLDHLDAAIEGSRHALLPELCRAIDGVHREYLGTDATYAR
jgi:aryl-alcohol dehydrogenase-like predicted oxidoreductase